MRNENEFKNNDSYLQYLTRKTNQQDEQNSKKGSKGIGGFFSSILSKIKGFFSKEEITSTQPVVHTNIIVGKDDILDLYKIGGKNDDKIKNEGKIINQSKFSFKIENPPYRKKSSKEKSQPQVSDYSKSLFQNIKQKEANNIQNLKTEQSTKNRNSRPLNLLSENEMQQRIKNPNLSVLNAGAEVLMSKQASNENKLKNPSTFSNNLPISRNLDKIMMKNFQNGSKCSNESSKALSALSPQSKKDQKNFVTSNIGSPLYVQGTDTIKKLNIKKEGRLESNDSENNLKENSTESSKKSESIESVASTNVNPSQTQILIQTSQLVNVPTNHINVKEKAPEIQVVSEKINQSLENNSSESLQGSQPTTLNKLSENNNPGKVKVFNENLNSDEINKNQTIDTKKEVIPNINSSSSVGTLLKIDPQPIIPLENNKSNLEKGDLIKKEEQKQENQLSNCPATGIENKSTLDNPFLSISNNNCLWNVGDAIPFGINNESTKNFNNSFNNANPLENPFIQNQLPQNNTSNNNEWNKGSSNYNASLFNQQIQANSNSVSDNSVSNPFSNEQNQGHCNPNPFFSGSHNAFIPGSIDNNGAFNSAANNALNINCNQTTNPFFQMNNKSSNSLGIASSNFHSNVTGNNSNFSLGTISKPQNNSVNSNLHGSLFAQKVSKFDC